MVRFDPADGGKPTQASVKTGTFASPPEHNPQREGFRFDGWTLDGQPYDLQTPVLQDTTLKAKWSKTKDWTLSPDHGPASGARLTISPPDSQEPYYITIQAAGEQTVGLTGDGSIYTWTKDSAPKQVPSPAQAAEGFHYLQAAAGSQWQAALGSDQQIYAWTSRQTTPTILNTDRNTGFTSISMHDDQLLAVDRQGRVHAFQASQAGSQGLNPEFTQQSRASLPGQAQAVLAAASDQRILIMDADGQARAWETSSIGKAEPERVKQEPGMHIIQAQALSRGFLLLDADGQARYLPDSTTAMTRVGLPDGMQASRITGNGSQAIITGTDGQVWAWQPGESPRRADDGSQQYLQADEADGRITAISRQGSLYQWNLDEQGKPGKPARLDTIQEPILESASMDGQTLTLTKTGDAWQADIPAHKPGPAAILITGRQDSQPFTRSLKYTVDQTLTRNAERSSALTVHFDAGEGNPKPADQNVSTPYGRAKRPSPDPTCQGYQFNGWFTGQVAYDFSRPITQNLTLTAKWTSTSASNTWSINPDRGSRTGGQQTTITPPATTNGTKFNQIAGSTDYNYGFSLAVGSDGNAYAWGNNTYGQLGDGTTVYPRTTPVMVKKPTGTPSAFTYVQVSAGGSHSLALGSDGYAYAWGNNGAGQLGNNTTSGDNANSAPVRVRDPNSPTDTSKGLKAIQVSAGSNHSLALGSDGNAYAWGSNAYGQLGDGTTGNPRTTPVMVKKPTGTPSAFTYVQVSSGNNYSLALGSDGYAYAWGNNPYGQLGNNTSSGFSSVPVRVCNPSTRSNVNTGLKAIQISAGFYHSMAVGSDGYAYAWGNNPNGQLGNNTRTSSTVPVRVRDSGNPSDASTGLKAIQISAGGWHSLAIDTDGNTLAWGANWYGGLGNNDSGDRLTPVKVFASEQSTNAVGPWLNAARVSAGYYNSLAIDKNGNTKAWGWNEYGHLGNGTTDDSKVPVAVAFNLRPVIAGVKFDRDAAKGLTRGDGNSVTVTTPAHLPGTVTVSVDYTLGGAGSTLTYNNLQYTYMPVAPPGVLPRAGGEGILLALTTGMTGMGGVLASRRHRREQLQLLHASHG
nr:InlB B-repeat-containing protein [Bifidobacterium polysaccharolyticum]